MLKPRHVFEEVYKMNYYYCLGWKQEAFAYYMHKMFGSDPNMKLAGGKVLLVENDLGRILVIWTREDVPDNPFLVHECVHAANWALSLAGVEASFDNDETQAYLTEFIFRNARSRRSVARKKK